MKLKKPPKIDEREPRHVRKKVKKGKKPFIIECRCLEGSVMARMFPHLKEWHFYRRYETEEGRDKAIEALQKKDRNSYEYRVGK